MGDYTPNYNLFKPGIDDSVDVVDDLNENFDKIDSALATNTDDIITETTRAEGVEATKANQSALDAEIARAESVEVVKANIGSSNTFIASQIIAGSIAGNVQFVVRGASSQIANLQEWQSSTSVVLNAVTPAGEFLDIGTTATTLAFRAKVTTDTQDRYLVQADGTIKLGPGNAVQDIILARTAAKTLRLTGALVIQAAASQIGNLQEWRDSTGVLKAYIDSQGDFSGITPDTNAILDTNALLWMSVGA
jgi:hypothetical protein